MTFDADIRHWPTIAEFTAYLKTVPRPSWCHGITNHNTYIPNEKQWAGLKSMQSMRGTYIAKGWSAGPHLYLAAEAPDMRNTGIWGMTPLDHIGVHAGDCNTSRLGIENVGDFDARPPTTAQYLLLLAINRAILQHWQLVPAQVNVHNECMAGRTCPGKYLTGAMIRADLARDWPTPEQIDPFKGWGPIGKPAGLATTFATPRAWLMNQKLGRCTVAETYAKSGTHSIAEFERGMIIYLVQRKVALIEWFTL